MVSVTTTDDGTAVFCTLLSEVYIVASLVESMMPSTDELFPEDVICGHKSLTVSVVNCFTVERTFAEDFKGEIKMVVTGNGVCEMPAVEESSKEEPGL